MSPFVAGYTEAQKAQCFVQGREYFQLQQFSVQFLILCLSKMFS